ncbi:alpha/beta-hydrolase [Neolentinus lepideus HHB14362 ss-1]|uniref:Alpha/beta-hydrolase n=1 Tax=Neolentinus lepideus HHB14362 ss-1 TaxID=1314782 RepID=A0A165MT88_9AGAM|nr:alpha/beta-hydrolase [Neolentinus lepideus HHB14362 ss-1]
MSFVPSVKYLKSSDGTRIYAEAVGDISNPSLVFTHGVSLSSAIFDDLFADERLLDNFYLVRGPPCSCSWFVRYDMRGHGRSDKPETMRGYESHLYASDFHAVRTAFRLDRPIFVGWSLGATVVADICAYLRPCPLSGVVFISALPYTGSGMQAVGKPEILSVIPHLLPTSTSNITQTKSLITSFVESFFGNPDRVPFSVKTSWMGMSALQPPSVTEFVFTRPQDPGPMFMEGRKGLQLLCICGANDPFVDGGAVVREMRPYFPNITEISVPGGSHAVFYDQREEVVQALLEFGRRVLGKKVTMSKRILVGKIWAGKKKFSFDHTTSPMR